MSERSPRRLRASGAWTFGAAVTLLLLLCARGLAVAQGAEAMDRGTGSGGEDGATQLDGEDRMHAQRLTREAERLYERGNFSAARAKYQEAYHASRRPELLFNVGQCHRRLGQHRSAIFFFDLYLHEQPRSPHRDLVESLIEESKADLIHNHESASNGQGAASPPGPAVPLAPSPTQSDEVTRVTRRRAAIAVSVVLTVAAGTVLGVALANRDSSNPPASNSSLGMVSWE